MDFPRTLQAIALPVELIQALNQTYFLHILANDPDRVIPPGKSLLSMLAHSRVAFENGDNGNSGNEDLNERIRRAAHEAFWDEAFRALSSPQPSIQLHRLNLLYSDLKDALSPHFPSNHPIIQTLSSPSAPSTSPLHSMAMLLKEILLALKQRCAPVRDPEIDKSMVLLAEIPLPSMILDRGALQDRNSLVAKVIISAVRSIMSLSEVMKDDLNTFVSGTMTDSQLKSVLHQQAKARERELVLRLWNTGEGEGQHIICEKWRAWVNEFEDGPIDYITVDRRDKWKYRLLQALQSSIPMACILPGADSKLLSVPANNLPPQYLFAIPNLLSIQNYIQALVITAALRSLLRIPVSSNLSAGATAASHFLQRVWTILAGEIEVIPDYVMSRPAGVGETKIAHLADELVHARRKVSEVSADEVAHLRAATVNILRPEDPVYLLLQRRLMTTLRERLFANRPSAVGGDNRSRIPDKLKAGKDVATGLAGKRLKLDFWPNAVANTLSGVEKHASPPKGFEDPILAKEVDGLFLKMVSCVSWIEDVWGDVV